MQFAELDPIKVWLLIKYTSNVIEILSQLYTLRWGSSQFSLEVTQGSSILNLKIDQGCRLNVNEDIDDNENNLCFNKLNNIVYHNTNNDALIFSCRHAEFFVISNYTKIALNNYTNTLNSVLLSVTRCKINRVSVTRLSSTNIWNK